MNVPRDNTLGQPQRAIVATGGEGVNVIHKARDGRVGGWQSRTPSGSCRMQRGSMKGGGIYLAGGSFSLIKAHWRPWREKRGAEPFKGHMCEREND